MRSIVSSVLFALAVFAVPTGAAFAGDDAPTESVSFSFAPAKLVYYEPSSSSSMPMVSAYKVVVDPVPVDDTVFVLYLDGREVGVFPSEDGLSPFLVDRLPDETEVRTGGHAGQIDIMSWSMDHGGTATLPDGRRIAYDAIATEIPLPVGHEYGHTLGLSHYGRGTFAIRLDIVASDLGGGS